MVLFLMKADEKMFFTHFLPSRAAQLPRNAGGRSNTELPLARKRSVAASSAAIAASPLAIPLGDGGEVECDGEPAPEPGSAAASLPFPGDVAWAFGGVRGNNDARSTVGEEACGDDPGWGGDEDGERDDVADRAAARLRSFRLSADDRATDDRPCDTRLDASTGRLRRLSRRIFCAVDDMVLNGGLGGGEGRFGGL